MASPEPLEPFIRLVSQGTLTELLGVAEATPPGCFVEVGVYQGGTAVELNRLAHRQGRALYLYDTFTGIPCADPDKGDSHKIGDFSDTDVASVKARVPGAFIISGNFPSSAGSMGPVAFAHVDVDQYKSTYDALMYLSPMMIEGGVIWVDDSPCLAGAHRAVREVFGDGVELSDTGKHFIRF